MPEDKVIIRNEDVPIHFKKGTKNCIHYKKEVNIFGDESKYADNIVIEYNVENVKKAKEEKKNESSSISKKTDEKENISDSWRDWKDEE